MGVVYRARYVVNNREVAVKMLPEDVTSATVLARFERELEVLKNLKHPNIVRSFGGVCEDKRRFYAMELVEGGTLEDQLRARGRLPWEHTVEYALQMCAALDYLHRNGIIHRDIKPANFLIADNGVLKLSDFGLASVIAARRITTAGKTAGTLLYMAPEQIRGLDVTPQTDLYALGCVLYELLTGEPPYLGDSPATTMHMHCKAPIPRVSQVALDVPASFDRLIARLMAKEPAERPADAPAVAAELRLVTPTVTVVQRPRAIDRPGVHSPTPTVESGFKETRTVLTAVPRRDLLWPFALSLVVIAGLLGWLGRTLHWQSVAIQSESLWVEAALQDDFGIRKNALQSIGRLKDVSTQAVDAVAASVTHEDPAIRAAAVSALGEIGPAAQPHVPLLLRTQKHDLNEEVRGLATDALEQVQNSRGFPPGTGLIVSLLLFATLTALGIRLWRQVLPMTERARLRR